MDFDNVIRIIVILASIVNIICCIRGIMLTNKSIKSYQDYLKRIKDIEQKYKRI